MDGELGALHGGQLSGDAEAQAEMLLILAGGVGLVEAVVRAFWRRAGGRAWIVICLPSGV